MREDKATITSTTDIAAVQRAAAATEGGDDTELVRPMIVIHPSHFNFPSV